MKQYVVQGVEKYDHVVTGDSHQILTATNFLLSIRSFGNLTHSLVAHSKWCTASKDVIINIISKL
jgi:hypothetical protein